MPTPLFWESHAAKLWPHRWVFGIATFGIFAIFFVFLLAAGALGLSFPIDAAFAIFVPAFCWLWGLTLVGVWFHPTRGTVRIGSPWFLRAPRIVQVLLRWDAAVFLALWFLFPLLVVTSFLA